MNSNMSNPQKNKKEKKVELDTAITQLLNGNFDSDSLICIKTIIKLIDNILSKPGNEQVRKIRITNPTIHSRIISRKGGINIVHTIGFIVDPHEETFLVLTKQLEDTDWIVTVRKTLTTIALRQLNCKSDDLPKFMEPTIKVHPSSKPSSTTTISNNNFNIYQGQRYDGMAASVGQTTLAGPPKGWKSATETQLEALEKKRNQLLQKQQQQQSSQQQQQRNWIAILPGQQQNQKQKQSISTISSSSTTSNNDSSLLAEQMKRQTMKRQKEESKGFTTKAMRDLEKLKNTKIYSHTVLAITFPDGCIVKGQFIPTETIQIVINTIKNEVLVLQSQQQEQQSQEQQLDFELYITPPRTRLLPNQTLDELQLVPAAKIYVSWKHPTSSIKNPSKYLQPQLLSSNGGNSGGSNNEPVVAKSIAVVTGESGNDGGDGKTKSGSVKRKKTKEEKQADMLKRMMGK